MSYEQVAIKNGFTYYSFTNAEYAQVINTLGEYAWEVNKAFLNQQIALGKTIFYTSMELSGGFLQEIEYLLSLGIIPPFL